MDRMKFGRDCGDCRLHHYDEETGRPKLSRVSNYKLPMFRSKRDDPPCHDCGKTVGMEERHWRNAIDPPDWAYRAFRHWRTCRAVGGFPPDRIVFRNALAFDSVREASESGRGAGLLEVLGLAVRRR